MTIQPHIRRFDRIAGIYGRFFNRQVSLFRERVDAHARLFDDCDSVLDLGCGSGALARVLAERGHRVIGVDASEGMLAVARRLNPGLPIEFRQADIFELAGADRTEYRCDLVVASFIVHGFRQPQRQELYAIMRQFAVRRVIVMDFNRQRSLLTTLIERLERSDYVHFIESAENELRQAFPRVTVVPVSVQSSWYVCEWLDDSADENARPFNRRGP